MGGSGDPLRLEDKEESKQSKTSKRSGSARSFASRRRRRDRRRYKGKSHRKHGSHSSPFDSSESDERDPLTDIFGNIYKRENDLSEDVNGNTIDLPENYIRRKFDGISDSSESNSTSTSSSKSNFNSASSSQSLESMTMWDSSERSEDFSGNSGNFIVNNGSSGNSSSSTPSSPNSSESRERCDSFDAADSDNTISNIAIKRGLFSKSKKKGGPKKHPLKRDLFANNKDEDSHSLDSESDSDSNVRDLSHLPDERFLRGYWLDMMRRADGGNKRTSNSSDTFVSNSTSSSETLESTDSSERSGNSCSESSQSSQRSCGSSESSDSFDAADGDKTISNVAIKRGLFSKSKKKGGPKNHPMKRGLFGKKKNKRSQKEQPLQSLSLFGKDENKSRFSSTDTNSDSDSDETDFDNLMESRFVKEYGPKIKKRKSKDSKSDSKKDTEQETEEKSKDGDSEEEEETDDDDKKNMKTVPAKNYDLREYVRQAKRFEKTLDNYHQFKRALKSILEMDAEHKREDSETETEGGETNSEDKEKVIRMNTRMGEIETNDLRDEVEKVSGVNVKDGDKETVESSDDDITKRNYAVRSHVKRFGNQHKKADEVEELFDAEIKLEKAIEVNTDDFYTATEESSEDNSEGERTRKRGSSNLKANKAMLNALNQRRMDIDEYIGDRGYKADVYKDDSDSSEDDTRKREYNNLRKYDKKRDNYWKGNSYNKRKRLVKTIMEKRDAEDNETEDTKEEMNWPEKSNSERETGVVSADNGGDVADDDNGKSSDTGRREYRVRDGVNKSTGTFIRYQRDKHVPSSTDSESKFARGYLTNNVGWKARQAEKV